MFLILVFWFNERYYLVIIIKFRIVIIIEYRFLVVKVINKRGIKN